MFLNWNFFKERKMIALLANAGGTLAALSSDWTQNTPLQSITLYLFFAGTVAMGAGAAYFLLMRNNVDVAYRSTMVCAGLVCGIACYHYFKMTHVYQESGGQFPTALRYIDWLFTTPLMLIKFPLLLRLGDKGKKFFVQLVTLDIGMIVCAFIAETSPVASTSWWGFFLVACVLELLIVATLYTGLGSAIGEAPAPLAKALNTMRLFILIGWAIYPLGFLMAYGGLGEVREIFYNVADVINKVGFGLAAYWGIEALSHSSRQTA
ncbi:MAG: bacteriorhodopsin-like [Pirellulales bacterium]|nr:bacteriorhodopsin-like [Pirellulales bacterium]